MAIEVSINVRCDVCQEAFLTHPWEDGDTDDKVRLLLLAAELAGWKVYRLARDVYYGKAWCTRCRKHRCDNCEGVDPESCLFNPTRSTRSGPPSSDAKG